MKKLIIAVYLTAMCIAANAQSGTNSPYSQYGLGVLSDQGASFNRGMNGLAYGFRMSNQVNYMNPASYSAVDSLTFIFDAGVSMQLTNFEENGKKVNARNADFEYAVATFRATRHLGISMGILPYTNVGYSYSNTQRVNELPSPTTANATYTNTYTGSGGIHEAYLGAGWEPFRGFSFGLNVGYLWGDYTRSIVNSYSDTYVNTISKRYTAEVSSYKIDLGVQGDFRLGRNNNVTLGLTWGVGHKLGSDPECMVVSNNSQTTVADTTKYVVKNGLAIPTTIGLGTMWTYKNKLRVGVDYQLQRWEKVEYPVYSVKDNKPTYVLDDKQFTNMHKATFGIDYCKNQYSRNFITRMHYRGGVSYATPYLKINGKEGPKELSVSAGFGIPIINGYNNRSILNISGQWVRQEAAGFIKENTFRLNIGFTFNERWFAKFKVD